MLEVPIEGVQDEADGYFSRRSRWNHRSGLQEAPKLPSRNQIQPDPAAQHTHDCFLCRRERVTVRAGLAISRRVQQGQPCWQFDNGWFLDLPYRVVAIRQVLNAGDAHRARQRVGHGGQLRWRALL